MSAIAATSAAELNAELTIALSILDRGVRDIVTDEDLVETRAALQRAAVIAGVLLAYMVKIGARITAASSESLIREEMRARA